MAFDAAKLGNRFKTPVFVIQGETDVMAPTALVQEWFTFIEAQKKAFVVIERGGHLTMFTMPDLFLEKLVATLRPVMTAMGVKSERKEVAA
jgi:pimeloyl-ACP methyl ester carboxylesterase